MRDASVRERLHSQATLMASGCLVWRAGSKGYGTTHHQGKPVRVHRLAWELEHGPIPRALTVDHVRARGCIYKRCINVAHMELVSLSENARRGAQYRWQRAHDENLVVVVPGKGTFVRREG